MGSKIGCQTGRVTIIDPNKFDSHNSSSNMSVPLEDLNISVTLKTFRKGRTVLSKDDSGGSRESSSTVAINFIEGTSISGGKKTLTTKYTDLTTVFENGTINSETLGITSIDIDFNPSMAPMITINFIDVRGSSIFQNEDNISGNNSGNKYATFFQLPYPMFELEVKGYYGKPVIYCLHMLKFNSKFNSQTGNFEIQCSFIGYTYAMLSDLLIGYLKAIPKTKIGEEKYKAYNDARLAKPNGTKILTLNELMIQISSINKGVAKISSESPASVAINTSDEAIKVLDKIKGTISSFGVSLDYQKGDGKTDYTFIVKAPNKSKEETDDAIAHYNEVIKANIIEFNGLNAGVSLDENDFISLLKTGVDKGLYTNISRKIVDPKVVNTATDATLSQQIGSGDGLAKFKGELSKYFNTYYASQTLDFLVDVYNMTSIFDKINKTKVELDKTNISAKETLAMELKQSFRDKLGFEPTVRNIIEIFTVAIEIMMETIYTVSTSAEAADNVGRTGELESVFKKDLVKVSDLRAEALNTQMFFAWPDYKEKDAKTNTYVDKYLGAPAVLTDPSKVDELIFIDDLLRAFIKSQQEANAAEAASEAVETTWYPVNPLDTKLFVDVEPYSRIPLLSDMEVTRYMVMRGMIFLTASNDPQVFDPSFKEVSAMAEAEADAILRNIKDPQVIQSLTNLTPKFVQEIKIDSGGVIEPLVRLKGSSYYYNFPNNIGSNDDENVQHIFPFNKDFSGYWPGGPAGFAKDLKEKAINGNVFLTNYSSEYQTNWWEDKADDGSQYIKILTPVEFKNNTALYPAPTGSKIDNMFILEKLKQKLVDSSAGYNSFGGTLGIQEYVNMDFGDSTTAGLPLMYVFYRDFDNGLAYNRADSGKKMGLSSGTDSWYDFNKTGKVKIIDYKEKAYKSKTDIYYLHLGLGKNRQLLKEYVIDSNTAITYPYIEQRFEHIIGDDIRKPYADGSFSLFGSKWYYLQDKAKCKLRDNSTVSSERVAKAILFLQTLPFNISYNENNENYVMNISTADPFRAYEIKHLFNQKAGFIHTPRLWCAYIGSILWRTSNEDPILNSDGDIIGGGRGLDSSTPINWQKDCSSETFDIPDWYEWFPPVLDVNGGLTYPDMTVPQVTSDILDVHLRLPVQVRNEFKRIFFDFVNGTDEMTSFDTIKDGLEIWKGDSSSFCLFLQTLSKSKNANDDYVFNASDIINEPNFKNIDAYEIITPILGYDEAKSTHGDYFFLELKGDSTSNPSVKNILTALTEELIIANNNYRIWRNDKYTGGPIYEGMQIDSKIFDLYFSTLASVLKAKGDAYSPTAVNKEIEQQIFGSSDENVIKLLLYTTCKNIHDKWLAGVKDPKNLIFQCGDGSRNVTDLALSEKYGNPTPRLIDSFRFVSRSFKDIGDSLYINPIPVNDYLIKAPNTCAYDAISDLLNANKFTFDALPTFINYRDVENVEAIFTPMANYEEAVSQATCGPTFVCVYAGQTSKHLDFKNSEYENDSFDFNCLNSSVSPSAPDDFTEDIGGSDDPIAVFMVRYGQQNQNIFKDINLDQSEFSETDESLQIQDEISQKGSPTNRSLAGQNLYNVYSVRSYSAEVEMMGNPMIQPMMYFQLDNIPMFHGAYMVTRVKHSIKPNTMSTNFTGTRIRYAETPLITAMDLFMSLVDSTDTSAAGTGGVGGASSGNFPPIVRTIVENGGLNGNVEHGNIKTKAVPKIDGIDNSKLNDKAENKLLEEAVDPLVKMLTDWVAWMKANGFTGSGGYYAGITSIFRDYNKQVAIKAEYKGGAATPGTSPHGWAMAFDVQFMRKDGSKIKNTKNTASSFDVKENPALKWLLDNSYTYGWVLPYSLRDKSGLEEHWHFEYHGTAAKCLAQKNPTTYGYTAVIDKEPLAIVKNPKGKDGKEAVYTDCEYKYVKDSGDGTEKSTVITKPEQAANQVKTKNFLKGKGLTKEQAAGIMGNMQQESTFNPGALNKKDLNGYASFGLIQWNEKFVSRQEVGSTLDEQLNHMVTMSTYKKFINLAEPKTSVEKAAYEFANLVEVCDKCNKGYETYKSSYQYVRTQFANDMFSRFNDKKDTLYW